MKISCVMPIYNGEKYLREAIASVLNQPYQNVELLCIDDGSNDSSVKIVESICTNDTRVRLICQNHGGVASARNKGIELATGEYVSFLDQDDVWCKGVLTDDLVASIERQNADIYMFSYYNTNEKMSRGRLLKINDGLYNKSEVNMQHHSAYLFNTIYLREHEVITDRWRNEDWRFLIRAYAHTEEIACFSAPLFCYRNNSNSTAHKGRKKEVIQSCLEGYIYLRSATNNKYIKDSCGLWAAGMFLKWVDTIIFEKDAQSLIFQSFENFQMEDILAKSWVSSKEKQRYKEMREDIKAYIIKRKAIVLLQNCVFNIAHIPFVSNIYYMKRYPIRLD